MSVTLVARSGDTRKNRKGPETKASVITALTLLAVIASGCGGGDSPSPGPPSAPEPPPPATSQEDAGSQEGEECGRVPVPGHEAVNIRVSGADCGVAKAVAAAAGGRGRAPYEARGFACEPAEAGGGDTNYTCSRGEASVRFRYGAV